MKRFLFTFLFVLLASTSFATDAMATYYPIPPMDTLNSNTVQIGSNWIRLD